jgi:hypothetical protein
MDVASSVRRTDLRFLRRDDRRNFGKLWSGSGLYSYVDKSMLGGETAGPARRRRRSTVVLAAAATSRTTKPIPTNVPTGVPELAAGSAVAGPGTEATGTAVVA